MMGFDDQVLNPIVMRASEFFLFNDCNVAFGHDWREDGVMRTVAEFAESAASGGRLSDLGAAEQRMLNLVPTTQLSTELQNIAICALCFQHMIPTTVPA